MPSRRTALTGLLLLLAAALPAPSAVAAPPPGYTKLAGGPLTCGGTWDFSIKRNKIQGVKGICLDLTPTFADGSGPGGGGGCMAGSLRAAKGIGDVAVSSSSGGATTTSLVGGLVYARARTVRITFADGKRLELKTHRPPEGWRRLLQSRVRYYAGDTLAVTAAKQARIAITTAGASASRAGPSRVEREPVAAPYNPGSVRL